MAVTALASRSARDLSICFTQRISHSIVEEYTPHSLSSILKEFPFVPLTFTGMRVPRPLSDSGSRSGDDLEGNPASRRSFIQTGLLLGLGVGMSVEPKSLQFLPMPMSDVRPRDHKVLLAVLAHTVEAVGIAKEFVGINVVKGTLGAVQSLLIVVKVR